MNASGIWKLQVSSINVSSFNKIYSCYQPCHLVMGTNMVPETSVDFNQLTRTIAGEDFVNVIRCVRLHQYF